MMLVLLLTIPAQIPTPEPGQEPWPWIAAIALSAVGVLFWKYDGRQGEALQDWKAMAKESAVELKANTTSVGKLTEALNVVGQSNVKLTESVDRLERRMERIEAEIAAGRARSSP